MGSVRVSFGPQHARRPHAECDALIEERWAAALAGNARLFDGSKFRLHAVRWQDGFALVELGLTGYKEYLGTNRLDAETRAQLLADGQRDHGNPAAHLSNALGCEAVLLTSDEQAVFLRRSGAVATHGGLFNGPSGHPEPSRAGVASADGATEETCRLVLAELFDSVLQEIHEETNVPREALGEPRLIGLMADATGKPDALFLVHTTLDAAAIREAYGKGAVEGWESDQLAFRPVEALEGCDLPMTAVTRAALACLLDCRRPVSSSKP